VFFAWRARRLLSSDRPRRQAERIAEPCGVHPAGAGGCVCEANGRVEGWFAPMAENGNPQRFYCESAIKSGLFRTSLAIVLRNA
jgi:hypothetical protein